eukprot:m.124968 g.124968  ORF g.124968 m.124968 type:complete len:149 (-) comp13520_c0_seq3:78-524(-)
MGTDSATALGLAKTLTAVCWNLQGGQTVIASQYQASQEIFETFDKVLVLQKEDDPNAPAQMVYFGPTDKSALEVFFTSVGYTKPEEYTLPDCAFPDLPTMSEYKVPSAPTVNTHTVRRCPTHLCKSEQLVSDPISIEPSDTPRDVAPK